jgi:hypothetical protein
MATNSKINTNQCPREYVRVCLCVRVSERDIRERERERERFCNSDVPYLHSVHYLFLEVKENANSCQCLKHYGEGATHILRLFMAPTSDP